MLNCLALILCYRSKFLVLIKRRIGTAKAGVAGTMDTFRAVVGNQFGTGIVGVEFDLIYCRDDLGHVSIFLKHDLSFET